MSGIRKRPRANGKYQGWFFDETHRRVWFVGTRDKKETEKIAAAREDRCRRVELDYDPRPAATAKYRTRPFVEVVDEFIRWGRLFGHSGKGWTQETADRWADHLQKWHETLSIERLADLDGIRSRVEAVLTELSDTGLAKNTLVGRIKPLIAFCRWCIGHGYLTSNPLDKFKQPDRTPETERRELTDEEIAKLFSVAPDWRRLAYATAICTGLRLSELRRLDRGDLDIENGRLHLKWKQTKNKKAVYVYLPTKLTTTLVLFADSGAPKRLYGRAHTRRALPETPLLYIPTHLLRCLDIDLKAASIPKLTGKGRMDVHALRVTSITLAAEKGANPKELMAMARHSDPRLTLDVYAKKKDDRMAALAERIGDVLPAAGCVTGVHVTGDALQQGTPKMRKPLENQALLPGAQQRGLDPEGFRPLFMTLR